MYKTKVFQKKFNSAFILIITKSDKTTYVCSSVAYSKRTLITAAHCLDGAIKIQVCKQDTVTTKNTYYNVKNFAVHKKYNPSASNYMYDIGKITLKEDLPKEINIYPLSDLTNLETELYRGGFGERAGINTHTLISA